LWYRLEVDTIALRALSPTPSLSLRALRVIKTLGERVKIPLPKMQVPNTFDSTRSKLKAFLIQAELYISFHLEHFPTKTDKVLWAVALLRGRAFKWIKVFVEDFTERVMNPED